MSFQFLQDMVRLGPVQQVFHFVSLHADAGYSTLLHTMEGRPMSPGMNGNIGVDYRLFHNNCIFSIGAEGMYQLSANKMEDLDVTLPMVDTEGDLFGMHVQVDKARDLAHMVNVNIPILVGGEWKRFYFMVGPKVSLNIYGAGSSTATFETYADYTRAYDDFHEMPNHLLASGLQMSSNTVPVKWERLNIMAHAEIGARFNHMFKHKQFRINPDKVRMYLAAYVDFGVLNLHTVQGGAPVFGYQETDHGVQFYSQPLMISSLANGVTFRNLNVGIKYTIAFEGRQRKKSYIYDYNRVERDYRKRGGNQNIH